MSVMDTLVNSEGQVKAFSATPRRGGKPRGNTGQEEPGKRRPEHQSRNKPHGGPDESNAYPRGTHCLSRSMRERKLEWQDYSFIAVPFNSAIPQFIH